MSRWLVNRNDTQFAVNGMAELRSMAESGQLGAGDMIQPPGATDWLYAAEVPGLQELIQSATPAGGYDPDDDFQRPSSARKGISALVLLAVAIVGGYLMVNFYGQLPDPNSGGLLGQVSFSEMVVTGKGVQLMAEASPASGTVTALGDGTVLKLKAKRGDFYRAKDERTGAEGWVRIDQVLPMYLIGGGDVMKEYDPLYNPDRYLEVKSGSWMQLPEQTGDQPVTVFQFLLWNMSGYDMTDVVMMATIKDSKGHVVEEVEFRVEGIVPAETSTMVGTIVDPDSETRRLVTQTSFDAMAEDDPELRLEYNDGAEVVLETPDVEAAEIVVVELRAIPKVSG